MPEIGEERWLTYAELGKLLGIKPNAARMRAKRARWPRRAANAIGAPALVLVPQNEGVPPGAAGVQCTVQRTMGTEPNGADQAHDEHVQAFGAALAALREQLTIANERAARADARADELQALLTEERRRVIEILTPDRRGWWRRLFR